MRSGLTFLLSSVVAGFVLSSTSAGAGGDVPCLAMPEVAPTGEACPSAETASNPIAHELFDRVVERYRSLQVYEDTVVLEQTTARSGELPRVEETELACELTGEGGLEVTTPREKSRGSIGLSFVLDSNPALETLRRKYDLWLAPHMGLRAHESPLRSFREGIDEGFMPITAERVVVDDGEMLRLDLHSGDGNSETYRAKYELFIHPQTLLIMRIRGAQILPDGSNLLTDYAITPSHVVTSEGEDLLDALTVSAAT